ncbi:MAG: hypothetical protein WBB45_19470 [Cyclobacteriaceae bacterium]
MNILSLQTYTLCPASVYGGKKDKTTQDTARTASANGGVGAINEPPIYTGEPPEEDN